MDKEKLYTELSRCRKCRFCIDSCPTFRLFGNLENIGPYGRVQILRHLLKGTIDINDTVVYSIYTCLTCAECNIACKESGGALEISELVRGGRNVVFNKLKKEDINTPEANLISYALFTIVENVLKKNDPVGLGGKYWTKWTNGLNIQGKGTRILYTSRMYQMIPYLERITLLMENYKNMIKKGKYKSLIKIGASLGIKLTSLKPNKVLKNKSTKTLRGIALALKKVGIEYGYLYDKEPYVGTLLYDLGLDEYLKRYIPRVYNLFKEHNIKQIISVDPHTHHLIKIIYPEYVENYDIEVINYLELLDQHSDKLKEEIKRRTGKEYVIHEPCTMSRKLNIFREPRSIAKVIGLNVIEPKYSGKYTRCCGGPIEFAYPEYTHKIAMDRVFELLTYSQNILTYCPICLMNLEKYARERRGEVFDIGELLYNTLIP